MVSRTPESVYSISLRTALVCCRSGLGTFGKWRTFVGTKRGTKDTMKYMNNNKLSERRQQQNGHIHRTHGHTAMCAQKVYVYRQGWSKASIWATLGKGSSSCESQEASTCLFENVCQGIVSGQGVVCPLSLAILEIVAAVPLMPMAAIPFRYVRSVRFRPSLTVRSPSFSATLKRMDPISLRLPEADEPAVILTSHLRTSIERNRQAGRRVRAKDETEGTCKQVGYRRSGWAGGRPGGRTGSRNCL